MIWIKYASLLNMEGLALNVSSLRNMRTCDFLDFYVFVLAHEKYYSSFQHSVTRNAGEGKLKRDKLLVRGHRSHTIHLTF